MKKLTFLFVFCFLFSSFSISQTGWFVINTGFNKNIYDIHFINSNTGWAVGDSIIIKTTNGGLNWVRQNYTYVGNMRTYLNSVRFLNENTGYAAGGHYTGYYDFYYQYIFKTINGGSSWELLYNVQGGAHSYLSKLFPIDQNTMYVTDMGAAFNSAAGGISKSTDGGSTFSSGFSKGEGNSLFFLNSNTGWTTFYYWTDVPADTGYIYKTTNGGLNWINQYRDAISNATRIKSMFFVNQNTGFAVGQKSTGKTRFFKTTNSGANWDTILYNHVKCNSVFFVNENTGWIGGNSNLDSSCISYTTNGGINWTKQKKNYTAEVTNLFFVNNLTGWATLSNSTSIMKTTTAGITFVNNISTEIPDKYKLFQNYPNPFNPSTNIKYQIKNSNYVTLKIFDILGKNISTLVNEKQLAGMYDVTFNGSDFPSGIYFYKLETEGYSEVRKMLLIK